MTIEVLKKYLQNGVKAVYAKRLNAERNIRSCYALQYDTRKGFHSVEQNARQLRVAVENEKGILLLNFLDNKIIAAVREIGENVVTVMEEEQESAIYQNLPRFDFTVQVQMQRVLKKLV